MPRFAPKVLLLTLLVMLGVLGAALILLFVTDPGPRDAEHWSLETPLPEARGELATAVAHSGPCPEPPCPELERLYVLGGMAGLGRARNDVASYGPGEREWREEPPLPEPRHHPAAAGLDGAVYLSGGTTDMRQPWSPTRDLWRLEPGGDRWEVLEPMPEGRWGHRMVEHDGRLFVIGGGGGSSRVLVYAPEAGWSVGAEMPVPRDHLSAVVADGRIWAIGGRAPASLARVDVYDPATDRWSRGPDLPAPTSGAAEAMVDGTILVYGGEEPALTGGRVFDRHWMLDTRAERPTWVPAPAPPLAVHGADGARFQGTMVIVGGASRHGVLSVTSWTPVMQRLDPAALRDGSPIPGA